MTYDFSKSKEDALTKPRDLCWDNWAKFEKVGDSVQGFIRDVFYRESEGDFAPQRGITLEQPEGKGLINVGIKHIDFVLAKTDTLRLGDPLTVVFEKEIPETVKGHSPTKQMAFYGKNMDENAGEKTVAQLEAEDKGAAVAAAEATKKANEDFEGTKTVQETPAATEPAPAGEAPKADPASEAEAPAEAPKA